MVIFRVSKQSFSPSRILFSLYKLLGKTMNPNILAICTNRQLFRSTPYRCDDMKVNEESEQDTPLPIN